MVRRRERHERREGREARRRRARPIGLDAPLWLNLLWLAAFALAVVIGVRVPRTGWQLGVLEIAFVVAAIGALVGSLAAARR